MISNLNRIRYQAGYAQLILYAVLALSVVTFVGEVVWKYNSAIETAKELEAANEKLVDANKGLEGQVTSLQADVTAETDRARTAQAEATAARKEINDIREVFANHDFNKLLQERPDAVIRRANAGTKRVFDDFSKNVSDAREQLSVLESPNTGRGKTSAGGVEEGD